MFKAFLTICLILMSFFGSAQKITLQLEFEDAMTQSLVDSVQVRISNSANKTLFSELVRRDEKAHFSLGQYEKIHIRTIKWGYKPLDTLISLINYQRQIKKDNSILLQLKLEYKGQFSGQVDISGNYKPTIIYASEQLEVSDYAIVDDKTMVLLVYPKRLAAGSKLIWYAHDSVINSRIATEIATELITDFRNRVYLRCATHDYMLQDSAALNLVKVSREELDKSIRPVEDTLDNDELFFNTYNQYYPAFDYYKISLKDTSELLLHHIEDTVIMAQYRSEYKWADPQVKLWAWRKEDETGIDRQIWIGANYFTNSVYYEPPYGDFFIKQDKAYVFDFYKNLMSIYNAHTGEEVSQKEIDFFLNTRKTWWETGWQKTMLQDPITRKVYTYYDLGGYFELYEINLKTGKKENKFTLFYRYPENIQVYNGRIYYLYRPFASIQKKYLYEEKLNNPRRNLRGQDRFNKGK